MHLQSSSKSLRRGDMAPAMPCTQEALGALYGETGGVRVKTPGQMARTLV